MRWVNWLILQTVCMSSYLLQIANRIGNQAFPLGVSWLPSEQAYNFVIFSRHAHRVELILFCDDACVEPNVVIQFDPLRNKTGPIWHCHVAVASAKDARFYGYRIYGPHVRHESELIIYEMHVRGFNRWLSMEKSLSIIAVVLSFFCSNSRKNFRLSPSMA